MSASPTPSFLARLAERLAGRQDVILAVFVVSVIFMLIIPLPTLLVDFLIATNISISVILLMVAVYLASPLDFAAFPSVLLITTLFRLALSISTTRLILLQADAGRIVETFGNFVVGGNLGCWFGDFSDSDNCSVCGHHQGCGAGGRRVSARFSLDALPGKQLSIDADMRSGAISLEDAPSFARADSTRKPLVWLYGRSHEIRQGRRDCNSYCGLCQFAWRLGNWTLQRGCLPLNEAISFIQF